MDASKILDLVTKVISAANTALDIGQQAEPFIRKAGEIVSRKDVISQDELDALEKEVDDLSDQLDAPLPPDDGNTTT